MAWRCKMMGVAEYAALQDQFVKIWTALGCDEGMALFVRSTPGADEHAILIPAHRAELVEALSPGGWADRENPHEVSWTLLVGRADAPEHFGLTLGR